MKLTQEISIFKPKAIQLAVTELGTRITQTAEAVEISAYNIRQDLGRAIEQNAADIRVMPTSILLQVSQTYATIYDTLDDDNANSLVSQITLNAENIESKVSKGSIISTINQSAEQITINAAKVNLTGYITATDLSGTGTTTINGSNITTGSISANRISGGTLTLGGSSNTNGLITVNNASGTTAGTWTNAGIEVIYPNTLKTSLLTSDGMMHSYLYNSGWKEIGNIGRRNFDGNSSYPTIGINALSSNCKGLTLCVNGTPYYALNTSDNANQGLDLTGYGFRHYFKGEVYCDGMFKTTCGYGWAGKFGSDNAPIVFTGANVRIENSDGYGHLFAASSFRTDGTCSAGYVWSDSGYGDGSDRRLKQDIVPLDTGKTKEFVMGLLPVEFEYKRSPESTHHGFIAQDVQEIIPERSGLVIEGPEGYLGISYSEIIADLVKIIQDQEARIDALERRNS